MGRKAAHYLVIKRCGPHPIFLKHSCRIDCLPIAVRDSAGGCALNLRFESLRANQFKMNLYFI